MVTSATLRLLPLAWEVVEVSGVIAPMVDGLRLNDSMPDLAQDTLARVTDLLRRHPLIDGHNDLPWEARQQSGYDFDRLDLSQRLTTTQTDLPRLRDGGVGAQFWSVWVPSTLPGGEAVIQTLEQVDAVHQMVARYGDQLGFARTADELEAVFASGRIASLMGAEGGHSIGCSLAVLRMLHVLGVRYLTLTHNDNVPWADSATDEPVSGGLSAFGVEVVREMNRIGMLVDLSHVSDDTMRDALAASEVPVIFSHSCARTVCDMTRNVPDDVLETLRAKGGVCMVTFVPEFVSPAAGQWRKEAAAAALEQGVRPADHIAFGVFAATYRKQHAKPTATIDQVIAHIEHVRDVAGVDQVGIGGDYDGTEDLPLGLEDVSGYPRLFTALADRGWSDQDLTKLAGGNVLRVMRDAEAGARDLQATRGPSLATYEAVDLGAALPPDLEHEQF
jgi:membrane dipeptidase